MSVGIDIDKVVGKGVGDCGISCNYIRTLGDMPTDGWPSVSTSVNVAFRCNYFRTLCTISTDVCPLVWMSIKSSVNASVIGAFRCNYF